MGFKPYAQFENDKNRSQKLANSYIDCLEILKNKFVELESLEDGLLVNGFVRLHNTKSI